MKSTRTNREFRHKTVHRILVYRDEFFMFMKNFTEDLGKSDDEYKCLETYFYQWTIMDRASGQPETDTREFEEFNQLLPQVLLAVIDLSLQYPELLDASPVNPDGTLRRISRRNIPYLFTARDRDRDEYGGAPNATLEPQPDGEFYNEHLSLALLESAFPPIVSTFE